MKNIAPLLFAFLSLVANAQVNDSTVYELRVYKIAEGKQDFFIDLFQQQILKLIIGHNMKPYGFWGDADSSKMIYIVSHASKLAMTKSWNDFNADPAWPPIKEQLNKGEKTVLKITSIPMRYSDIVSMNSATNEPKRYELRIYTCLPNRLPNLITRFKTKTTKLFAKHNIENIAYWTTIEKTTQPKLAYIIAHKNKEAQTASWDAFRNDPDWISHRNQSENDGKIVEKIESINMIPFSHFNN